ncbi:DUF397 domain-containing protein [Streptomyces sp. NPDC048603]|uniref:DUF397 domain-containing protein n=1 Tax=Streptomyces sp. NPDC048603 TaxID=3365577 RepID=UPI003713ACAE
MAGFRFRKSSYSGGVNNDCVEVATNVPGTVAVRDSKRPGGPVLRLAPGAWEAALAAVSAGSPGRP